MQHSAYQALPILLERFRERRLALIHDDISPSARGILIAPAEEISAETVNEILSLTPGLLFVALSPTRSAAFMFAPMARPRTAQAEHIAAQQSNNPHVCISVEAREGISTGISAHDRACTIRILGEATPSPRRLVKPGHIFPVECREGGVLVKNSLPEAALDLVCLSGFRDAALFTDLLDQVGEFVSAQDQFTFCEKQKIPCVVLSEIIRHRLENEQLVSRVAEARLPTRSAGELRSVIYKSSIHSGEHLALIKGELNPEQPVLTRVQTEFTLADAFGGQQPPTRAQLQASLKKIGERGSGVLLYLRRPMRGQLREQIETSTQRVQEKPASMMRDYGIGAQILRDLGVKKIELLTNSEKNLVGLNSFGIEIVRQTPLGP